MSEPETRSQRVGRAEVGLGLMAVAGGSDALAYLTLGNVFTSAMTGNTVLLCIAVGQGRLTATLQSFTAFAAFVIGAMLAAALARGRIPEQRVPPHLMPLFLLEIAFLAAFVAMWFASDRASEGARYVLIALSALAMGVQGLTARQINVPQVNTIVFTTTIIGVVASCTHALLTASAIPFDTKRQIGILLVYAAGAVLMAVLIAHRIGLYVWLPLVAVIGAFACYEAARRRRARPGSHAD